MLNITKTDDKEQLQRNVDKCRIKCIRWIRYERNYKHLHEDISNRNFTTQNSHERTFLNIKCFGLFTNWMQLATNEGSVLCSVAGA